MSRAIIEPPLERLAFGIEEAAEEWENVKP